MSEIEWELIFISPRRQKQTLLRGRPTGRLAARLCGTNDARMILHLTLQPVLQTDLLHYTTLRF